MALPTDLIASLAFIHPRDLVDLVKDGWPQPVVKLELRNEIRPIDLYCYLGARFGQPNGIQNLLRSDDSDNLIHWEWTLRHANGFVSFAGLNFRTEITVFGVPDIGKGDRESVIEQIKGDFASHGAGISTVRNALERWVEFVNPYQRIRRAVDRLFKDLRELKLDPERERLDDLWIEGNPEEIAKKWSTTAERYSKGFGLCFGIRSMLPVLAESFVNLLMYVLLRPDVKQDERLRENLFRQPIDVRVKSLAIYCMGFKQHPDYESPECKRYHSLVNERNDLLHGNVVIDKLKFNEVYFFGKVPVFREYRTVWERSFEIEQQAVGFHTVASELEVVDKFVAYLLSCLDEKLREMIEELSSRYDLGLNVKTLGVGILFPPWLVDFRAVSGSDEQKDGPDAAV